jgi:hypothetical protein
MRNLLCLCGLLAIIACKKDETEPRVEAWGDFDCLETLVDKPQDLAQAQGWIQGTWQQTGMITMMPQTRVPAVKIVFKNHLMGPTDRQLAEVYENDRLVTTVVYILTQTASGLTMVSENPVMLSTGEMQLRGRVLICEQELMIDNGMAFDAPAYLFRRR